MPGRISQTTQTNRYAKVTPGNQAAMKSLRAVMANPTEGEVNRQTAILTGALQRMGVKNTGEVWYLLENMRKTRLGDGQAHGWFKNNVVNMDLLGLSAQALPLGNQAAKLAQGKSTVAPKQQPIPNSDKPCTVPNKMEPKLPEVFGGGDRFEMPFEKILKGNTTQRKTVSPSTEKKATVETPRLDAAIKAVDYAGKIPGTPAALKSALEGVKSSLELAREAQKNGETAQYTKHIAAVGEAVFKTTAEIVKAYGQNPELATQAFNQLGKVASVLGGIGKAAGALDNLARVFNGTTLGGKPVTNAERVDAGVDLIKLVGGSSVGIAVTISKYELEWIFNNIGVPANRSLRDYGLKNLFGTSPEALKDQIRALPTDPENAMRTMDKIFYKTFKSRTSGMSQATAESLWKQFAAREMQGYNQLMSQVVETKNRKPREDPMTDELRTRMAESYKSAALRFIDAQVAEAKGNWP